MNLAFGREHPAADQTRDEPAGLPRLLVDGRVLEDVREGDGVEREEAKVPLWKGQYGGRVGVRGEDERGRRLGFGCCGRIFLRRHRGSWVSG
jgi:hypothetical protein